VPERFDLGSRALESSVKFLGFRVVSFRDSKRPRDPLSLVNRFREFGEPACTVSRAYLIG
jgi:hypothetical protein